MALTFSNDAQIRFTILSPTYEVRARTVQDSQNTDPLS